MTQKSFYSEAPSAELERLDRTHGAQLEGLNDGELRSLFRCYGRAAEFEWARFIRNRNRGNPFPGPRRRDLLAAIAAMRGAST
jgi:hypothetical protein